MRVFLQFDQSPIHEWKRRKMNLNNLLAYSKENMGVDRNMDFLLCSQEKNAGEYDFFYKDRQEYEIDYLIAFVMKTGKKMIIWWQSRK